MAKDKFTFKQFQAQYPDDAACLDAIMQRRYGQIEVCPSCGVIGKLTRIQGRRAYACKEGCHIYPCAGTVFEHSSTTLTLWFHAMYLMTSTRNGVSAKELERQLGVTYKCAWRIGHQLRLLMAARDKANNPGQLSGHVEIDETWIGGRVRKSKALKRGRRNQGPHFDEKTAVMGFIQRGGAFKGQVIPNAKKSTLIPLLFETVEKGAVISTDNNPSYTHLSKYGYEHGAVNHSEEEWKRGIFCTNRIEGFWSHLKRGIRSTHASVSSKHLQKYVDEFAFRYNFRDEPSKMFNRLLRQISQVHE